MTTPLRLAEVEALREQLQDSQFWNLHLLYRETIPRFFATIDHLRTHLETATLGEAEAMLVLESTEQEVKRLQARLKRIAAVRTEEREAAAKLLLDAYAVWYARHEGGTGTLSIHMTEIEALAVKLRSGGEG